MREWIFEKNRLLVISLLFAFVFSLAFTVFAAGPFAPGETLQPDCGPDDGTCIVSESFSIDTTTIGSGTTGSVLFVGAAGVLQQDNTNFFWDNTNNQLLLGLGSATAPSYGFVGDADTGLYSAGAGQINVTINGAEAYRFGNTYYQSGTSGGFALRKAAGSASVPTYTFAGDLTTGMFLPAAGSIGFTTGGTTERLRITSTGNVGVGDTSPLSLFTVGSGDLFQINTSGAITSAAGITSSGTINFSGLTASKLVFTDASKNLTSSGAVPLDQGGTGLTSTPTNGQLLIGNGSGFTLATLSAGSNINITNGAGTITIDATGGGGGGGPEFDDDVFRILDDGDSTKKIAFEASGISTSTTRTLTVPNASGTLVLTSDLSSYLPIAGGTLTGTGGSGFIGFPLQSSAPSTPASGFRLYADSSNAFSWKGSNGFVRTFDGTSNTADRSYILPDASGMFPLTTTPGTSGTDVNWSATGTLNIPDASTTNRGLVTTGTQTFLGDKTFNNTIVMNRNGASVLSVGTTNFTFRTTNGGSNVTSQTMFDVDSATATTGAQGFAFETANGFVFTVSNGARRIARGALKITNAVNTAGSETGDLSFYTKASGAGIAERFRIDTAGKLFATSGLAASSGTPDALCMNTSTFEITHNTGTATCTVSSLRFKHDINTYTENGLDIVNALRPVTYAYNGTDALRIGFIAEEVEQVDTRLMFYEADGVTPRGVRYEDMVPVLTKGLQELDIKIEPLLSLDLQIENSLANLIKQFLANVGNSISDLFADRVHTKTLCIGDPGDETCISKTELDKLLKRQNISGGTNNSGEGGNDNTPSEDTGSEDDTDSDGTAENDEESEDGNIDIGSDNFETDGLPDIPREVSEEEIVGRH